MSDDLLVSSVDDLTTYDPYSKAVEVADQTLGKDEFLKLLVAQLENQDPMEPMDDTEYIAQLAQFSTLEQMQNMNDNLEENLNWNYLLMQTINNTMSTGLIGKEIKASGNQFYLSSETDANLQFKLEAFAATTTIKIYDGSGGLVDTLQVQNLGAGNHTVNWDGILQAGDKAPSGEYTFEITSQTADGASVIVTPYIFGLVDGVEYEDAQAYLIVDGAQIPLSDVIEVNEAASDESAEAVESDDSDDEDGDG